MGTLERHRDMLSRTCRWGTLALLVGGGVAVTVGAALPVVLLAALLGLCLLLCLFLLWLSRGTGAVIAAAADADGVQERRVIVDHGYRPNIITVEAGRPVRLIFDRREDGDCSAWVVFPTLGLARQLTPHGRTGIELVPERPGSFTFSCKYGVCHGTLDVQVARTKTIAGRSEGSMSTSRITVVELRIEGMTCQNCVAHVERALRKTPGVQRTDIRVGHAVVAYDAIQTQAAAVAEAVRVAGYEPHLLEGPASRQDDSSRPLPAPAPQQSGGRAEGLAATSPGHPMPAGIWGMAGMVGLMLLYAAIVGGASRSFAHIFELLATDWPFVAAIAVGFGVQVGLYAHLRHLARAGAGGTAATGVGTGTSTLAMIACCAHHATDIIPILGLSAIASTAGFLAEWRIPLMSLGVAMNFVGIALSLRLVLRARRHLAMQPAGVSCH